MHADTQTQRCYAATTEARTFTDCTTVLPVLLPLTHLHMVSHPHTLRKALSVEQSLEEAPTSLPFESLRT